MKLATRIKNIREKLQLKQNYVASQLDVSQQAYSALEIKAEDAPFITLKKIASVFEVDIHFLINQEIPIDDNTLQLFKKTKVAFIVNHQLPHLILSQYSIKTPLPSV